MRCVDLIRELSVPTGSLDAAAIATHAAQCPQCAAWMERDAQLSRVWEATQPVDLSDQAWERIWANASAGREAVSAPALAAGSTFPRTVRWNPRRWTSAFVAAQAAAILVAALVLSQRSGPQPVGPNPLAQLGNPAPKVVEIDQEQLVMISMDGQARVRDLALNDNPNGVTPDYPMLNFFESIAAVP